MTDGVVVESTATAHWAWVGVRLLPASTDRSAAERAWLAGLWTTEHGTRWEVRCRNGPPLSCVLLGRVHGRDATAVPAAAVALRDRLATAPGQLQPIMDADEVRACLAPLEPAFELRKRLDWAPSGRRDTDRRVCFAMAPLVAGGSWDAVWPALARLTVPTTVGIYLEPCQPSADFAVRLGRLATEYTTLARKGRSSPMWPLESPPDPFATTAAPGYVDAVRRYAGRCHRLRISVAGSADRSFAALLGAATGTVACRVAPQEVPGAWRNLATMDRQWLDETYRQGAPAGELDDTERILCDLVDETEAGAAFRLPTNPALFRAPGKPTGKRVFLSYVKEDLELVQRLELDLNNAGYDVWLDRSRLLPGRRWRSDIMRAIADSDFFIPCFSPNYWKDQTFMNEELIVAVERQRLMPRDRTWLIPAMLAECRLPDHALGPNETIGGDMQYADFGKDWDEALRLVIAALGSR
ncbi:MAG TPA: toll/interleukin-1 receptor domain-containing protein [Pseudonocardiaceae bacterium]